MGSALADARLRRVVGLPGAVGMGLGSILGTGVFVSLGIATDAAGSAIVIAVAAAGLLAAANGLSSAQLAAAHPVSGGTYEYGHVYVSPMAGFLAGWMFLVAKSASAATAALGSAGYLLHVLDLPSSMGSRRLLALSVVLLLTALVAGGVRRSNRANLVIVSMTLVALACFVGVGGLSAGPGRLVSGLAPAAWSDALAAPGALLRATALTFVAYTGYGRIATLGEEVRDPAVTIPRAIIATLLVSMVVYLAVSATAVAVVGAEAFAASTREVAAPLEVVARAFGAGWVPWVVAAGAVTTMWGVLVNLLLGLSRVLLAMARRRDMPAALAVIDDAGSPRPAVWAVGALIGLLVLLGDLETTWSFSAFAVLVYYGLTNLAALRLPAPARRFPRWIAWAGLVSCLGLAFFVERAVWMAGLGLIAVGLLGRAALRPST